jgi:hypothetical protein
MINKNTFLLTLLGSIFVLASCSPLLNSATPGATSLNNSTITNDFWIKVSIAGVSAVLSFLGSFVLNQIKQRKEPRKQISYDLAITKGLVSFEKNVQSKVKVLYDGRDAENLFHVTCNVRNSGNTVIKNEFIRFKFSDGSQVVDFYYDPKPEREMGVGEVQEPDLQEHEKKYKISHTESGQEVGFCFVLTGRKELDVTLHPFNEQGDVAFLPQSVSRAADDYYSVKRFITLYIWLIILPVVFNLIPVFGNFASTIVRLAVFVTLIPYIPPFVRQLTNVLFQLSYSKSVETQISIRDSQIERMDIKTEASAKE